jgi:galactokinase
VNLIGDHTDYTGGLVLPMAIDLGTEVQGRRGGDRVRLESEDEPGAADVALDIADPAAVAPPWARYVAGVVAELVPPEGFTGRVTSTLPLGAGLSSSAALEVAVALALGADPSQKLALARLCQAAEQRASGVPCGIMDQLCITSAVEGHALLIDCATERIEPVPLPREVDVAVLYGGERRSLAASAYGERRAECTRAEEVLGVALNAARADDVELLADPLLRRRARHVVSENARVRTFAEALRAGDWPAAGAAMIASHNSLRDDFEVSTAQLDALVASLLDTPGVFGARLTGAGFGGCVVALTEPGALPFTTPVRPAGAATVNASGASWSSVQIRGGGA